MKWKGAFAPPRWPYEFHRVDAELDEQLGDGGRAFALSGVYSIFEEALAEDLEAAAELLADVSRGELLKELRTNPDAEALANEVSADISHGVLCELSLPSMGRSSAWIPGYSRALDAWAAGFALGSGTDEHGAWRVTDLGLAKRTNLGPAGLTARHAAVAAERDVADGFIRRFRIDTEEGGEKAVDFMDLVRDIASGKRTR